MASSLFQFTFHYVSIKSTSTANPNAKFTEFTFHYVSIKSLIALMRGNRLIDLHSTMYLLNP